VLRTAEQPMTATDIARKMPETHNVKNAGKTEAQIVAQAEGKPAKWTLKRENAA
jgi:hypothetical protein